jgi:hypothetical protein
MASGRRTFSRRCQAQVGVETGWRRQVSARRRIEASVGFRAETWSRYGGLDRLAPSASVAWSRKFGLGPQVPRLVVAVDGEWRATRESDRGSGAGRTEIALRRRFGDLWPGEISHQRERLDARSLAFVQTGRRWSARVERAISFRREVRQSFHVGPGYENTITSVRFVPGFAALAGAAA